MSHIIIWAESVVPSAGCHGVRGTVRLLCRQKLMSPVGFNSQEGGPPQWALAGGTLATLESPWHLAQLASLAEVRCGWSEVLRDRKAHSDPCLQGPQSLDAAVQG